MTDLIYQTWNVGCCLDRAQINYKVANQRTDKSVNENRDTSTNQSAQQSGTDKSFEELNR